MTIRISSHTLNTLAVAFCLFGFILSFITTSIGLLGATYSIGLLAGLGAGVKDGCSGQMIFCGLLLLVTLITTFSGV